MKRISISLTEPQLETMRSISKETGIPISEHIRRALDTYIKLYKKEKKEVETSA